MLPWTELSLGASRDLPHITRESVPTVVTYLYTEAIGSIGIERWNLQELCSTTIGNRCHPKLSREDAIGNVLQPGERIRRMSRLRRPWSPSLCRSVRPVRQRKATGDGFYGWLTEGLDGLTDGIHGISDGDLRKDWCPALPLPTVGSYNPLLNRSPN